MIRHPLISGANAGFVTPIKWTNFNNCSSQNPVPRSKLLISPGLWLQSGCAQNMVCSQGGWRTKHGVSEESCDKSDGNEALPAATKFHADSFPLEKLQLVTRVSDSFDTAVS